MYPNLTKRQCLLCLEDVHRFVSAYHLLYDSHLCLSCMQKFEVLDRVTTIKQHRLHILFHYNDFFRQLLYQYKGLYDIALKYVFLDMFIQELKHRYHNYIVVIAPSSKEDNKVRGFNPNYELASLFSKQLFCGVYKTSQYKQTKQKDRKDVYGVLDIKDGNQITNKKVVILDDVITSGYTLLACIALLMPYHPKTIEVLVLATHQDPRIYKHIK